MCQVGLDGGPRSSTAARAISLLERPQSEKQHGTGCEPRQLTACNTCLAWSDVIPTEGSRVNGTSWSPSWLQMKGLVDRARPWRADVTAEGRQALFRVLRLPGANVLGCYHGR